MTINPDPVPLRLDERGDIRIGDSRVLLDVIINRFHQGMAPDDIARNFPTVTRADVYAVLAYYLRHQVELDEYLRRRDVEAEELRQQIMAAQGPLPTELKRRMDALRAQRNAGHAASSDCRARR